MLFFVKGFFGYLSFLIPCVLVALVIGLHKEDGQDFFNTHFGLMLFSSTVVPSAIISLFSRMYNHDRDYQFKHTFMFIPAEYIFFIWTLMGLLGLILPKSVILGLF